MPKIKSIMIREEFATPRGFVDMSDPESCKSEGYPLPAFPVEHKIPTDSNLVYVVGRNGSGKSTLLEKLWCQYGLDSRNREYRRKDVRFGIGDSGPSKYDKDKFSGKYFDVECEGDLPKCEIIRRGDHFVREEVIIQLKESMLSAHGYDLEELGRDINSHLIFDNSISWRLTTEENAIVRRLNFLSSGELQRLHLMGCIADVDKLGEDYVLLVDEPEASLDMVRRREFWNLIRRRYERGLQTFLATHDADFIRRPPPGALVLKVGVSKPAQLVPVEEFDVDKYIEEEDLE